MKFHSFLIKYGEIGIKGKNRYIFEDALVRQIRFALKDVDGEFYVHKSYGRVYVDCDGEYDYEETVESLARVFGIVGICPVVRLEDKGFEELKKEGMWFVCADMDGQTMYDLNLTGPIGLVIGNEGAGVSRLVKEKCDFTASIPMKGDIDSLNASVAAGVLAYEIVRQRLKA